MLLAIDVGNTNISLGVFENDSLKADFRRSTPTLTTADEIGVSIVEILERNDVSPSSIEKVVLSSVVPSLTQTFQQAVNKYFGCRPVLVTHDLRLPIRIDIDHPEQVGADRIANAVAVHAQYGGPAIVVDFGTATNFDVVDGNNAYIGGVLLPGPETSMAELARRAARLFEVGFGEPKSVVGRSTADALKSGLFYGTIGQIDYIMDRILEECGFDHCTVLATGGLAAGIEKHSRHIKIVSPTLTLEGLRLIGELN